VVKTPERDLSLLLAAVLDPPGPPPELLVRYVEDPASLSDAERAEVEDAVSADPLLAGELRALQGSQAQASPGPSLAAPGPWLPLRTGVWVGAPLAMAAAAAAFVALWSTPNPSLELEQTAGLNALDSLASLASPAPLPDEPAAAPGAPALAPEPALGVEPVATAAVSPPASAPREKPKLPPREPEAVREPPAAATAPAPPLELAFLEPRYQPPPAVQERYRSEGATRAAHAQGEDLGLEVLAPAHVALTRSPAPSLFWSVAVLPADSTAFTLTLSAAMTPEPLLERALPRPERVGLQRIRLASYGVELQPGIEYTWTISAEVAGRAILVQGWILRIEPVPELASASAGEQPARYAAAGLWYDAVEALADLAEERPGEARVASALRALAAQARSQPN
jgi:hypothetical protein